MARSKYIYVVFAEYEIVGVFMYEIVGVFTVKHEMETMLEKRPELSRVEVRRYRDGQFCNYGEGYGPDDQGADCDECGEFIDRVTEADLRYIGEDEVIVCRRCRQAFRDLD